MGAETLGNNENFQPIEKKEINYDDFLKGLEKSTEQMLQIRNLEQKDKKQEEQEINIYELYFNGEINESELKDRMLSIDNIDLSQIEIQKETLELSETQTNELIETGREELQQQEKLKSKILQLDLISDISGMHKEYLQSILSNIKLQFLSNKDERFEEQIEVVETEIRNINNIIEYLSLLGNTNDLLKIDTKELLNKLIVSEEKLVGAFGILDQPISFIWNEENSVESVNTGYENIKQTLSNHDVTSGDIESTRVNIFNKIRGFDGLDDDKHRYNTSEAIRTRLTDNVLNNPELNKDTFVKSSFDLIKNFQEQEKKEFYEALNSGKDSLNSFLEGIDFFSTLGIENNDDKENLIEDIFDTLKEGKDNIDDEQLKEVITTEVESKVNYLKQHITEENKAEITEQIKKLETSLSGEKLDKYIENIKIEVVFKSFERIVISKTLENKSSLVKQLSNNNTDINLYRDIEGIGSKFSDETFNSISSKTQFLAEQIAIMAISGGVGTLALKGVGKFVTIGKTTNIFKGGTNLSNLKNLGINSSIEGTAFYLSYTGLNGLVNEKEAGDLFDNIDSYDAMRTIIFLGVLRAFSNTTEAINLKNVAFDTRNIIGTDLVIRGVSQLLTGKEGIDGLDLNNLSNSDLKEIGSFLAEELEFIIPLVIGLRMSERFASNFKNQNKLNINITTKENAYVIKIKGLQKEIRILKQRKNIARNKGQETSEINQALKEKKTEYKELKNNPENIIQNNSENMNDMLIQETQASQSKVENKKRKSNADESTSMNTGTASKFKNLERYSKEAQEGKIDYALKDLDIEGVLTQKGIGKDGKSVGEGLLKKSGFSKEEIRDYNRGKLKSEKAEKPIEKRALREMEKANEVVYKEYLDGVTKLGQGIDINKSFPNVSPKLLPKLSNIVIREKTGKKERL